MFFDVRVRVNLATIREFGQKLQMNALDRSAVRSETYCLKSDPAVGFSIWEATDRAAFDKIFAAWKPYYSEAEVTEVITAREAMGALMRQMPRPPAF